jgi:glycosyltransferase involved in cell wall biosynthesis
LPRGRVRPLKPRLVVIGPVPPPHHGVAVSTSLALENEALRTRFEVEHLNTTDPRSLSNVGRWDARNVTEALSAIVRLTLRLRGRPGLVYLPVSQGIPGLARDTMLIRIAKARGWRVAVHLRGSELGGVYRRQPKPVRAWLRGSLARMDSLAVLGDSVRNVLDGVIPASRVVVVPNGTPDPGPFNGARNATGLFLGNMYPRKGALEAMEAAVAVTRQRPEATFVFAGEFLDPGFSRRLRHLAEKGDGRIILRGPALGAEKQDLLFSSGFLLFPPRRQEGQPRVVLEAMASGLPVITTDRGAIAETVEDGAGGYVLPAPVPGELANRIVNLYDHPEVRASMGRAARDRYLERFTQATADHALADWLAGVI